MKYIIILSIAAAIIAFLMLAKNFNKTLKRFGYFALFLLAIVSVILFIQPDDYIKYNSDPISIKDEKKITKPEDFILSQKNILSSVYKY